MKGLLPQHEEVVARTPFNVNAWSNYLDDVDSMVVDARQVYAKLMSTKTTASSSAPSVMSLNDHFRLRDLIGRRAVQLLPRSYKLWKSHWEFSLTTLKETSGSNISGADSDNNNEPVVTPQSILQLFERALVTLHKFPRVWMEYLEFSHRYSTKDDNRPSDSSSSSSSYFIIHPTQLRRLADRALEALPVTQHDKLWPVLLQFYQTPDRDNGKNSNNYVVPKETKLSILRRYLQFNPAATKEVADFFAEELDQFGEAALLYVDLLNGSSGGDDASTNKYTAVDLSMPQRKDLWMSLAKICTRHPLIIEKIGLDFDAMVRAILVTFHDQDGRKRGGSGNDLTSDENVGRDGSKRLYLPKEMEGVLWSQLADSWIRRGEFQLARSVYEEALESVSKVRDFTILLDAYLRFEEGLLEATMQNQADDEEDEAENDGEDAANQMQSDDWDILLQRVAGGGGGDSMAVVPAKSSMSDLELALARAEDLTARRPILLNRVLLRQNPDDVGEWLKRARLYKENEQVHPAASALEEALQTVKARRAVGGNPNQLVLQLVKIYEQDCKDLPKARNLLDRVCNQWVYEFKNVDDLAECYTAWVELELRQEAWDNALDIIRSSVVVPSGAPKWARGLAKSLLLWDLLLDLEESLGTLQTTKDAYSRAIGQKVVTPVHILNFAHFLTEQKYFEEAFGAYERGIEVFQFPAVKVIWKAYLNAFLKRYGGTKLERTRDLFQRCLDDCPPEDCTEFFLMDGKFEEEHGLTKRALGVYRQMCQKVLAEDKYTAYQLYIAKTAKHLGQTATRDIYQSAIQDLDDDSASRLCLDFAEMESSLQEFDRARAVLTYGAQMADPRRNEEYWNKWNEFEITNGNEETFREMLRIKRSVESSFSTVNYNAAEMSGTATKQSETLSNDEAMIMIAEREGLALDPSTSTISGFVGASGNKRSAQAASLDEMEERVAKLRTATATTPASTTVEQTDENEEADADADEIDIDDELDEDEDQNGKEASDDKSENATVIRDVSTKAVPAAVFGGLAEEAESKKKIGP